MEVDATEQTGRRYGPIQDIDQKYHVSRIFSYCQWLKIQKYLDILVWDGFVVVSKLGPNQT